MRDGLTKTTIHAAIRGEMHAFEQVVFAYEKPVFSFIYKMVRSREDAADLTQETFVKVYLHMHDYDSTRPLSTWIFTIAKYTTYDWLRKVRKHEVLNIIDDEENPYTPVETRAAASGQFEDMANAIDVRSALDRIRPRYRHVLKLFYWQQYSYKQIAEELDTPMNTVKTLIRRAKQALAQEIAKR